MSIQLITFDLDDTFWHAAPAIDHAEDCLRQWLSAHVPKLGLFTLERLASVRQEVLKQDPALRHRVSSLRRRLLQTALVEAGYSSAEASEAAEQGFQVFLAARHHVKIFPEVKPVLEALHGQYRLGVLTNGNANVQRLGLGQYFQFALSAEELGIGKPEPHPFQEALHRAGVSACHSVHVGDHPLDDIQGAKQMGLRAIWFNPSGAIWTQEGHLPDAEIRNLKEVPALIRAWDVGN